MGFETTNEMVKYALIGDVHSQDGPLSDALEFCNANGLTPVLLGDIFDSRCETGNALKVYNILKEAQSNFRNLVILRSNHQSKLERYLKGTPVNVTPDLEGTLEDFAGNPNMNLGEEVLPWLLSFPFGFVFKDSKGKEYRCAHAYFPTRLEIPKYAQFHKVFKATRKERDLMMYGLRKKSEGADNGPERVTWWLNDKDPHPQIDSTPPREWVRVAGHYHSVFLGEKSLILDGDMGGRSGEKVAPEDMALCLYDVESESLHKFKV